MMGEVVLCHLLPLQPGVEKGHHHWLPSLLIPMHNQRTVAGTAAIAVAAGVALPVFAVPAVVVDGTGVD